MVGGAELSARDQCRVLQQLGHRPIMMTNNRRIRHELAEHNIGTVRGWYIQNFAPPLRYILFWLGIPLKFVWDIIVVLVTKPDVINPHSREDQITLTLGRLIHRRPVVWKDPGDMVFVLNKKHGFFGDIYKRLYLAATRRADHIYLLNPDHLDRLASVIGSESRLSAVPSSILYADYSPANDHEDRGLIFGSISRLVPEKDIASLIRAFIQVETELDDARLIIYGDGPEKAILQEMAEGYDSISFAGWSDDISASLNSIDVFVQPALEEGWGRNIKEAMYFGKPIIGSRAGGIAQQIIDGQTGLLFPPGDSNSLADKMLHLSRNPELRRQLAKAARQKALADGDFTQVIEEQILPIYIAAVRKYTSP